MDSHNITNDKQDINNKMICYPNNDKLNVNVNINVNQIQKPFGVYLSSVYVNGNTDDCDKTDPSRKLYDGYFLIGSEFK